MIMELICSPGLLFNQINTIRIFSCFSEWVIVVYHQFSNFSEQVDFQWNDDEVRFVLDQHAELEFYSASSLKQQSTYRHVLPLGHIILIPSQPVFVLSP
jgi:hypothetical protein